jgi:NTE family protein
VLALERMQVLRLLDPTSGRPGLFKGERIISVLRELSGECAIEDLPMAFIAVATELGSSQEVWLREGPLFDAIQASIATPMEFTPFQMGDRTLLDGALVNPVPIAPTLDDRNDPKVVVNLSGPAMESPMPAQVIASLIDDKSYRARIARFIDGLQPARADAGPRHGLLDVAFLSMQAMQDTIAQPRLSTYTVGGHTVGGQVLPSAFCCCR